MSFVTALPAMLASAAGELQNIGTAVAAGNSAAAGPTTGVVPAAADEVSALTAAHFAAHGALYQELSAQATAIHELLRRCSGTSASSYAVTEAANAAAVQRDCRFSTDYGALPPEINSARMYAGPVAEVDAGRRRLSSGLAAELHTAASLYGTVIAGLTSGPWLGPSATAMAAAAAPYVTWMGATAGQAELAATQAQAAASAYASAFAATVPLAEIAENRAQLIALNATNFFGQNTPAIAATEAGYAMMWAQDAAAMYGYAANSAAATSQATPFTAAPQTTTSSGLAAQAAASVQSAGSSLGTGVQSVLSQLTSAIPTALQTLASPSAGALGGSSSAASSVTTPLGVLSSNGFSVGGIASSLVSEFAILPAWFGISAFSATEGSVFGPLWGPPCNWASHPP